MVLSGVAFASLKQEPHRKVDTSSVEVTRMLLNGKIDTTSAKVTRMLSWPGNDKHFPKVSAAQYLPFSEIVSHNNGNLRWQRSN